MKVEDIARLWNESKHANDPFDMPEWRLQSTNGRDLLERFARACEQHGIERTVAALQATVADSYTDHLARLTRERVAAELKKETDE